MGPSPSPIESLPIELLRQILAALPFAELSRLGRCNKSLQRFLEPILFESEAARTRAMKWACEEGVTAVIRLAISYGSPASTIPFARNPRQVPLNRRRRGRPVPEPVPARDDGPTRTLTLGLAAKHGQLEAFQHLIDIGARVDADGVDPSTIRALVERMCCSAGAGLLAAFLRAGLATQLHQELRDDILLFVLTIPDDTAREFTSILLNCGANPNCARSSVSKEASTSPLSLALVSDRTELFDLLLEHGAEISGVLDIHPVPAVPCHIPICAAVHSIAQRKTVALVQRCLDHGARLDVRLPILRDRKNRRISFTTPLLLYLKSISSWEEEGGSVALQTLEYLLGNGAVFAMDASPPDDPMLASGRYSFEPAPTPLDFLLDKWTISKLTQPVFLSALKLLAQYGSVRYSTGSILARYDYDPSKTDPDPAVLSAWIDFLVFLLGDPRRHEDINNLLFTYIIAKGVYPQLDVYDSAKPTVTDLAQTTIARLVGAGADINFRQNPEGPTSLHELCWRYSKAEYLRKIGTEPPHLNSTERLTVDRARFLRFLVECGADRTAEWEGRTPVETLRLGWEKLGDSERARVDHLVGFLEGTDSASTSTAHVDDC